MSTLRKLCDVFDAVIDTTGAEEDRPLLPIGFVQKKINPPLPRRRISHRAAPPGGGAALRRSLLAPGGGPHQHEKRALSPGGLLKISDCKR